MKLHGETLKLPNGYQKLKRMGKGIMKASIGAAE